MKRACRSCLQVVFADEALAQILNGNRRLACLLDEVAYPQQLFLGVAEIALEEVADDGDFAAVERAVDLREPHEQLDHRLHVAVVPNVAVLLVERNGAAARVPHADGPEDHRRQEKEQDEACHADEQRSAADEGDQQERKQAADVREAEIHATRLLVGGDGRGERI
jgi:hypothetical protein